MHRRNVLCALVAVVAACVVMDSAASAAQNKHRARARLFGPTIKGHADYEQRPKQGQTFKRFKVQLQQSMPLQSFDIAVNGELVGVITTNAGGFGTFEMRTAAFIDSPEDGIPIPANFPFLDTGDIVTVGPGTGVFFDRSINAPGMPGNPGVQKFRLRGDFGDDNVGAAGHVKYQERFKNNGLERRFEVEVENASAGESFDILVNGQLVGTLVAGQGDSEFQLRTAAFIDDPGDGQPMPASFPSLQPGAVVQVGGFSATLELD